MAESPPPADKPAQEPVPQPAAPEAQAAAPAAAPAASGTVGQDAIDDLVKQAQAATGTVPEADAAATPVAAGAAPAAAAPEDAGISQESIDALLKQANFDGPDAAAGGADAGNAGKDLTIEQMLEQANFEDGTAVASEMPGSDAEAFKLPSFQQVMADAQVSSIDLLRDVELNVKIELGRSRMLVEDVLKLGEGSVVELDKLAGDPVDVFVNDRLVARGEVLVLNDSFCVRVNEIVPGAKEEAM